MKIITEGVEFIIVGFCFTSMLKSIVENKRSSVSDVLIEFLAGNSVGFRGGRIYLNSPVSGILIGFLM